MSALLAWTGLTDLADQAVVLPLALLVFVALRSSGRDGAAGRRAARGWALAVGGVLLALLVLKLWAGACTAGGQDGILGVLGVRSPSGHTAAGGIVYGGMLALVLGRGATVSALCCLAAAAAFGASRLALGVHSPGEVALGCAVAAAGGAVLAGTSGWAGGPARRTVPRPRDGGMRGRAGAWAWVGAALILVWILHGRRLPAEPMIARVASAWLSPLCGL